MLQFLHFNLETAPTINKIAPSIRLPILPAVKSLLLTRIMACRESKPSKISGNPAPNPNSAMTKVT